MALLSPRSRVFLSLFMVRLASVFVVTTHFVPDEYWQSLEVAHRMTFGYGYLTWEWRSGIRNCLYPSLFAFLYKVLQLLNLDYRTLLIVLPRVVQAAFSAVGETCTVRTCRRLFGESAASWTLLSLQFSWFLFYSGSRTLTNTMETALTAVAIHHYPWPATDGKADAGGKRDRRSAHRKSAGSPDNVFLFLNVAAVSVIIRPTSLVLWLPMCSWHLLRSGKRLSTWLVYCGVGLYSLGALLLLDRLFYGRWLCSLCNFVRFNVIDGHSAHYGTHPFHFYWTLGFPTIMATHLLPFLLQAFRSWRSPLLALVLWQLLSYSLIAHKEFRFIMPVLPVSMCFVGKYLASIESPITTHSLWRFWNAKTVFALLAVTNLAMALPLGMYHMRAPLYVMSDIAALPRSDSDLSVLFLTPCHATPLYSHLHRNITTRFLTCEPNLLGAENYTDEADIFFDDPLGFLHRRYGRGKAESAIPTHLVLFENLVGKLAPFLRDNDYRKCGRYFHSLVEGEGRTSGDLLLVCAPGF